MVLGIPSRNRIGGRKQAWTARLLLTDERHRVAEVIAAELEKAINSVCG
jgi:hypothetical protein